MSKWTHELDDSGDFYIWKCNGKSIAIKTSYEDAIEDALNVLEVENKDLNNALEEARRGISEIELEFEEDGRLVKKKWKFGKDKKHFWIEGITPGEHGEGREVFCCEQILELIMAFDKEVHRLRNGVREIIKCNAGYIIKHDRDKGWKKVLTNLLEVKKDE